jgi:hypothetical protein
VKRIEGVLSPVITPFGKDYSPDAERFVRHCRWLLTQRLRRPGGVRHQQRSQLDVRCRKNESCWKR